MSTMPDTAFASRKGGFVLGLFLVSMALLAVLEYRERQKTRKAAERSEDMLRDIHYVQIAVFQDLAPELNTDPESETPDRRNIDRVDEGEGSIPVSEEAEEEDE